MNINEFIDFIKCSKALEKATKRNVEALELKKFEESLRPYKHFHRVFDSKKQNLKKTVKYIMEKNREKIESTRNDNSILKLNEGTPLVTTSKFLIEECGSRNKGNVKGTQTIEYKTLKATFHKGFFKEILKGMYEQIKVDIINKSAFNNSMEISGHNMILQGNLSNGKTGKLVKLLKQKSIKGGTNNGKKN